MCRVIAISQISECLAIKCTLEIINLDATTTIKYDGKN